MYHLYKYDVLSGGRCVFPPGSVIIMIDMKLKKKHRNLLRIIALVVLLGLLTWFFETLRKNDVPAVYDPDILPPFSGQPYAEINGNEPFFTAEELSYEPFETYSELDSLGRCGPAFALISRDTMPSEERGDIRDILPSGWKWAKYDFIEYEYLYNRCHLIAYALSGENDNPLNLITGTRYLNYEGMRPFEGKIASYVYRTSSPVLYRVTPVFRGNELVARGVLLEAASVEDDGLSFCVYCYNVQPGVIINYATGDSHKE